VSDVKEVTVLTQGQINVLYTRGLIDRVTWNNALRALRGINWYVGSNALKTCEVAIEALVERAVDAACATIQDKLGVPTGDLAAATLADGTIERELTRYVHAELAMAAEAADEALPSGETGEAALPSGETGEAALPSGETGEAALPSGETGETP
jgi:hypothetical protein